MSMHIASPWTGPVANRTAHTARPTFAGVLRGELFKLSRQRLNWVMAVGITIVTLAPYLYALQYNAASTANHLQILQGLRDTPSQLLLLYIIGQALAIQRVAIGILLLIATARMVGLDFHNGTIRVLLARGVGRLQLLGAKLAAMALVGLVFFAWGLMLNAFGAGVILPVITGSLDPFRVLMGQLWIDVEMGILAVLVSMGVSILLAAAVTVVTRSLSLGLAGALGWFAVDNVIMLQLLMLIYGYSNNLFWLKVSAYLLGPELNVMPSVIAPAVTITGTIHGHLVSKVMSLPGLGATPFVTYDGRHALMVALVYSVIFAVAAVLVIWRPDVLE